MSGWAARRFWTAVGVRPCDGGWEVLLDDRPVRTPAQAPLRLPGEALARMIAGEWQSQGSTIDPATMPATRMANSAIDRVAPQHEAVVALVAAYGGSDLLCHRAAYPEALVRRQRAAWDGPLDWAAAVLGVRLATVTGVMPLAQDAAGQERLRAHVAAMPPFELAPVHDLVTLSGSLVLGLAVAAGALSASEAWRLSRIDEDFQAGQWGEDAEATSAAERRGRDFHFAHAFLQAVRQ